jgi:hypothetical protein
MKGSPAIRHDRQKQAYNILIFKLRFEGETDCCEFL